MDEGTCPPSASAAENASTVDVSVSRLRLECMPATTRCATP